MDCPRQPSEVFQLLMAEFHDRLIVIFRCMDGISQDGFEALQASFKAHLAGRTDPKATATREDCALIRQWWDASYNCVRLGEEARRLGYTSDEIIEGIRTAHRELGLDAENKYFQLIVDLWRDRFLKEPQVQREPPRA